MPVATCRLHAIDLTTGHEKNGSPSQILAASKTFPGQGVVTFDATKQLQRPGLTLAQASALPCSRPLPILRFISLICIHTFRKHSKFNECTNQELQ